MVFCILHPIAPFLLPVDHVLQLITRSNPSASQTLLRKEASIRRITKTQLGLQQGAIMTGFYQWWFIEGNANELRGWARGFWSLLVLREEPFLAEQSKDSNASNMAAPLITVQTTEPRRSFWWFIQKMPSRSVTHLPSAPRTCLEATSFSTLQEDYLSITCTPRGKTFHANSRGIIITSTLEAFKAMTSREVFHPCLPKSVPASQCEHAEEPTVAPLPLSHSNRLQWIYNALGTNYPVRSTVR